MGLTARLARFGYSRPRSLVVAAPGATAARLAIERVLRQRGGFRAASAADADTLLVCGTPTPGLAAAVDRVWRQMPQPRARVHLSGPADADAALDEAVATLTDVEKQRGAPSHADPGVHTRIHGESASGATHGGGGSDGGGGHDHGGGHEQMMVAGLPMADRAPDRDGLKLDQLQFQLGPVLPDWPDGLVLHAWVQGDVVQEAHVEALAAAGGGSEAPFWDAAALAVVRGEPADPAAAARLTAAAHLDSLGRLLGVAGWADAATRARRLRDDLLGDLLGDLGGDLGGDGAGRPVDDRDVAARLERFTGQLRRSRTLRWLLDGVGVLDRGQALAHDVRGPALPAGGDATARLMRWLDEARAALAGRPVTGEGPRGEVGGRPPSAALLDALPPLVTGLDLAEARLVVASLDPDLDQLVGAPAEAPHG